MNSQVASSDAPGVFPKHALVVCSRRRNRNSPESAAALEAICRAYWCPLYAYVRRCGQPPHDAQDLTQEFSAACSPNAGSNPPTGKRANCETFLIAAAEEFHEQGMAARLRATPGRRPRQSAIRHGLCESRYAAGQPCARAGRDFRSAMGADVARLDSEPAARRVRGGGQNRAILTRSRIAHGGARGAGLSGGAAPWA